ncbi:MAG: hypothetical protein ACI4SK_06790 [Christensenellales bacterium]
MKKRTVLLLVVIAICVFLLSGCVSEGNIAKTAENNTFGYNDLSSLKKDWTLTVGNDYSVESVFSVADGKMTINTVSAGWAQAAQEVSLKDNSYYLVEYTFTATSFSSYGAKGYDGLYVSILEDEDFNTGENAVQHRGITTSATTGKFYFKTNSAKKTTIAIHVGNEEFPVSVSNVTISDFKLVQVPKSEAVNYGKYFVFESDTYNEASEKNVVWVVLGAIAIALLGYFAYVTFQRNMAVDGNYSGHKCKFMQKLSSGKWLGPVLVGGITFGIRLLIDLLTVCLAGTKTYANMGYTVEGYASQALFIANYGTVFLSESLNKFCTANGYTYMAVGSNPILLYILGLAGLFGRIFEKSNPYLATVFFVKLFATIADVGTVMLIYVMLKKRAGNVGATIMSVLYAILPVTFGFSSLWGFAESITVFFIVLTVFFMLKNNYYGVAASYFVAFLCSWTALIFAPIVICYSVQQAINRKDVRIPMIVAAISGFVLFYVLNLPFDINQIKAGQAFACVVKYWNVVAKGLSYTVNAFNFQALLGNNFGSVSTESLVVSIIFVAFMLALVAVGYFKFKNRMDLILLGTAFINMVFMFANNMSPEVMLMNLALMLVYAIMNKEKRIYFAFVAFAVLSFVNVSVGELLYEYTAEGIYFIGYQTATIYVFSAFALALTLYYVYVVYDIVVTKKARKIQPMTLTYIGWWKNLFLRVKKFYYGLRVKTAKQK